MVTILRRLVKEVVFLLKNSQNSYRMAWRSVGSDNGDLMNQLESKLKITQFPIGNESRDSN